MTVQRAIWLICDVCDESSGDGSIVGDVGETVAEAVAHARDDGWHRTRGGDVCPLCWANGNRPGTPDGER